MRRILILLGIFFLLYAIDSWVYDFFPEVF